MRGLHLPDWWIGAGFVRSKVWDELHGYTKRTPLPDIDFIYFDPTDFSSEEMGRESTTAEVRYEQLLRVQRPEIHWSVTNQARMHVFHKDLPYKNSEEAIAHWVETATCIAVTLTDSGELTLIAPQGISDLMNLTLRPTPGAYADTKTFDARIKKKEWLIKWPKLWIARS